MKPVEPWLLGFVVGYTVGLLLAFTLLQVDEPPGKRGTGCTSAEAARLR